MQVATDAAMDGIAWLGGSLDGALAQGRARQLPLLLYWGAAWCPPCNRLKAVVFGDAGVQRRLAAMLAYQLDGDSDGAQALAARVKLRSYPTLVLFAPDGAEITRLPAELDGDAWAAALNHALAVAGSGSHAAAALDAALQGQASAAQWTLLSQYAWDTDEGSLLGRRDAAGVLTTLAALAPPSDAAVRLDLHAQIAQFGSGHINDTNDTNDTNGANSPTQRAARLLALFNDARLARVNQDILLNHGFSLVRHAADRERLAATLHGVVAQWADDLWLNAPDRLAALRLRLRLARLATPADSLQQQVLAGASAALDESTEPHERHALLNTAAAMLNEAGLAPQAAQLLEQQLSASHAPYYFMLSLAGYAKRRGDKGGALRWYELAWRGAIGPATRIQWGVTYLSVLVELAPYDEPRADEAAQGLLHDVRATGDAGSQRNLAQLRKLAPLLEHGSGAALSALCSAIERLA